MSRLRNIAVFENGKQIFTAKSLTQQHFREKTDINCICKRIRKTGLMPPAGRLLYGDFSNIPDSHEMFEKMDKVRDVFMSLPPELRDRFQNQPARFLKYMEDPKMHKEQIELGLRIKAERPPEMPVLVKMVPEKPASAQ